MGVGSTAAAGDTANAAANLAAMSIATALNRTEATMIAILNMQSNLMTQTANSLVSLAVKSFEAIGAACR
jgi:hypothetical protein